ncbi:MAG: hypothetical protein A2X19_01800 [Bacteroidetes bacterium GWE2_39_28]|nr:MAG: hypothetical protein A2X19_01800 [Bacteroidetes bacterium GWE2_39_28]OFY15854.1 MAG: hypothetical protein A2X16_02070 [Bacteroidetes bacterium GWF2_39_10]OFZ08536.1 MAG: hypothetical protein A2322_06570 [Bacteroidetes bacterium RIFOXYB2_FULL_39_7]OFZ10019.1 MAG: hypothetical protein A2465_07015 [Bacteroidetes bacterium RIFOXYC2_FULL_39_11]HCT93572.1 hypothetical protein [Rikenellaceae bacterium]
MKKNRITFLICLSSLLFFACEKESKSDGKDTDNIITTAIPLIDFGTATYRGFQGGLYPNASNIRPPAHNTAGIAMAKTIKPLNTSGTVDETNGKIVWLSIGMSNVTMETQMFLSMMQSYPDKNPKLSLVDGAVGGQEINAINSSTSSYWDTVESRLAALGLSPAQVQIIWFKEAEARPTDTSFVTYPDGLKDKYKSVMQLLKLKFQNLKLVYLSDRIYAGYANTNLNPEPFAWYAGWTVKRLIESQINGDASLNYAGNNPSSAWLSWGPYLWANGITPRSDGLIWVISDYQSDGTHPSTTGRQKVAQMLLQFFSTDETTKPWFLKTPIPSHNP